jgi:hypothetical protein
MAVSHAFALNRTRLFNGVGERGYKSAYLQMMIGWI